MRLTRQTRATEKRGTVKNAAWVENAVVENVAPECMFSCLCLSRVKQFAKRLSSYSNSESPVSNRLLIAAKRNTAVTLNNSWSVFLRQCQKIDVRPHISTEQGLLGFDSHCINTVSLVKQCNYYRAVHSGAAFPTAVFFTPAFPASATEALYSPQRYIRQQKSSVV